MLGTLIQSKTRLKLLLRFFLNPDATAWLRGLAEEFDHSTNSVRVELNRFEEAGLITSRKEGNKKVYRVNTGFPLYHELQQMAYKHLGIDQIVDRVIQKLGILDAVYLTGDMARGLDAQVVEMTIVGDKRDREYLERHIVRAERIISKTIHTSVYTDKGDVELPESRLLIFGEALEV